MILNTNQISDYIIDFFRTKRNPTLFAGAGVSVHAGLPDWKEFLINLAENIKSNDPNSYSAMLNFINECFYCEAASIYKLTPLVTEHKKYSVIEELLDSPPNTDKLSRLVSLPFTKIVTTNYDTTLLDAYCKVNNETSRTIELCNDTLKRAPYLDYFYIARIHG